MSRTYAKKKTSSITAYLPIFLLLIVLGVFIGFSDSFSQSSLESEKDVLQNALERSITQCYALEGSYPNSLEYLEEHYGVQVDRERYTVMYEIFASNLMPDVTVLENE